MLALLLSTAAHAVDLTGTVSEVAGDSVKITLDSELVPNSNDKVEFYFKVPGLDEEIAVTTGVVSAVEGSTVSVKFDSGASTPQPATSSAFTPRMRGNQVLP